jgi:glycosyltransferase involved in cell wall biosynthesis
MRIAIYWEQESWGGVDAHLHELLSTWPDSNDEFVLFYNEGNQGFARIQKELAQIPNLRCVSVASCAHNELSRRIRARRGIAWLRHALHVLQPVSFLWMVSRLRRAFEKAGKFDLLLADNGAYPAAWGCLCALFAARQAGIPARVLLVHHAASPPALFMGWFELLIDRYVSRVASKIICVSQATRNTILEKRRINDEEVSLSVIHNGVRVQPASLSAQTYNVRQAVCGGEDLLIGIVGRVAPYKGQEDVIFAAARLTREVLQRIRIVVIGSGEKAHIDRLRNLACQVGVGERVHFLGYISGASIDLIEQLDLLVVATRSFEGFGLTLVEAMLVGTPVLATRVGAIPELIDERTGYLVPPASPGAMADAFIHFVAHHAAWKARARAAKENSGAIQPQMAAEYRQTFLECIASAGV